MNARLVRDPSSICLSYQEFKREIGSRRQELLDRLSKCDHKTNGSRLSARRFSIKRSVMNNRIRDLPSSLEGHV